MPIFNILYFTEYNEDDIKDNSIIILYDIEEESYYYYGTRNRNDVKKKYIDYKGSYSYYKKDAFTLFLELLMDNVISSITMEFHQIEIKEEDYDSLNYYKLKNELSQYTELFAYDKRNESAYNISKYLDLLVPIYTIEESY